MPVSPFIKWVGGKTQLIKEIYPHIPENIDTYVEPFLGGGAMFLYVLENRPDIKRFILNDMNNELISVWNTVQNHPDELIDELEFIQYAYNTSDNKSEFYYKYRESYNEYIAVKNRITGKANGNMVSSYDYDTFMRMQHEDFIIKKCAEFIFLNKTCFNGLYRVNKQGLFNVPFNNAKSINFNVDNIKNISNLMKSPNKFITFVRHSYDEELNALLDPTYRDMLGKTFYYLDPPYKPVHSDGSEVSYTSSGFNDNDQIALKELCDKITQQDDLFIESNSDPDDKFFDTLYKDYYIKRVGARRNINSDGNKRGKINELLISNFKIC